MQPREQMARMLAGGMDGDAMGGHSPQGAPPDMHQTHQGGGIPPEVIQALVPALVPPLLEAIISALTQSEQGGPQGGPPPGAGMDLG